MSYAKEIVSITLPNFCRLSTMHERDRQTDRQMTDFKTTPAVERPVWMTNHPPTVL